MAFRTPDELESLLGEHIKSLRLQKNITRKELCARASVSETALRNLEGGKGSTVTTLMKILKSLGRESAIDAFAPKTSINPLHLSSNNNTRQRARKTKCQNEVSTKKPEG